MLICSFEKFGEIFLLALPIYPQPTVVQAATRVETKFRDANVLSRNSAKFFCLMALPIQLQPTVVQAATLRVDTNFAICTLVQVAQAVTRGDTKFRDIFLFNGSANSLNLSSCGYYRADTKFRDINALSRNSAKF
jgi:hypothetical protein